MVKAYLKKTLDDPSSYQVASFDQVDSMFSFYSSTEEAKKLHELAYHYVFESTGEEVFFGEYYNKVRDFEIKLLFARTTKERQNLKDSIEIYRQKGNEIIKLYEENETKYKGEFLGWRVEHNYRAKNKAGALVLENNVFFLNKELTVVSEKWLWE